MFLPCLVFCPSYAGCQLFRSALVESYFQLANGSIIKKRGHEIIEFIAKVFGEISSNPIPEWVIEF